MKTRERKETEKENIWWGKMGKCFPLESGRDWTDLAPAIDANVLANKPSYK